LLFLILEIGGEELFVLQRDLVLIPDAADHLGSFVLNFGIELLELIVQFSDFRIGGPELSGSLSHLDAEIGLLAAQAVEL